VLVFQKKKHKKQQHTNSSELALNSDDALVLMQIMFILYIFLLLDTFSAQYSLYEISMQHLFAMITSQLLCCPRVKELEYYIWSSTNCRFNHEYLKEMYKYPAPP